MLTRRGVELSRDFALEDASVTAFMHEQLMLAFAEDVAALSRLEQVLAECAEGHYEISFASDAAAVAMRRHLKERALAEAGAARINGERDDAHHR